MAKRKIKLAIISDTHLGTYGCHANELLQYLKSIEPEILVLNGDIIDIWNLSKRYFPKGHIQVLRHILKMTEQGTKTYYITGNHDEALRKYSGIRLGNFILDDKLILDLDGQKVWIFHGDIFDATTKGWAHILAKLGGKGYDILIWTNRLINHILKYVGREKVSFSKKIKSGVKKAVKWISNFEDTAAQLAIDQKFDTVICSHIHQPQDRTIQLDNGKIKYLNSGDWVENCTALEYHNLTWSLYKHPDFVPDTVHNEIETEEEMEYDDSLNLINLKFLYENTIFRTSNW